MIKVKNGKDFKKAMTAIALKTEKKMAKQINQKLAIDSFNQLVFATPVDYGYLRHNWDISIDIKAPDDLESVPEKGKKYKAPKRGPVNKIKYNSIITIYNNTSYAAYVENGTEKMEAQSMVAPVEMTLYRQAEFLCKDLSIEKFDD